MKSSTLCKIRITNALGKCGARLEIDWAAARTESAATKPEAAGRFEHPALVLRRAYMRELARVEPAYSVPAGNGA